MGTALMEKSNEQGDFTVDDPEAKKSNALTEQSVKEQGDHQDNIDHGAGETNVFESVSADNGMLLNDIALEAEVVSFIDQYRDKEISDLDRPAVVLSQLRTLYKAFCEKIERSGMITRGILTKYGIRRGMMLNIEKRLLQTSGKQWLEHYAREYGETSLRTAQDYMKLGNTPNIINYAVFGKERLIKILRAIKIFEIKTEDPIATLFGQCNISFNPDDPKIEDMMKELKLAIDQTVAIAKIKKAEEKKEVKLDVDEERIKTAIKHGVSPGGQFIRDLFEIKSEGRDVNSHLESLSSESGQGDDMLPHIKKVVAFPKIVETLKDTAASIRQHNCLAGRVNQNDITDLEDCIAELKTLIENQGASD